MPKWLFTGSDSIVVKLIDPVCVTADLPGSPPASGCRAPNAVLPTEVEPTLHRGHHDDPAHKHGRQGAGSHDCLGQEIARYPQQ